MCHRTTVRSVRRAVAAVVPARRTERRRARLRAIGEGSLASGGPLSARLVSARITSDFQGGRRGHDCRFRVTVQQAVTMDAMAQSSSDGNNNTSHDRLRELSEGLLNPRSDLNLDGLLVSRNAILFQLGM
jgi:hypothetical protein